MRTRLNIRSKTSADSLFILDTYLIVNECLKSLKRPPELKYTYLCVLLFLKLESQLSTTSIYPGCFNPHTFNFSRHWITPIYYVSLQKLCKLGMIKKEYKGAYSFTELGNSFYWSYVRLMDHRTRSQSSPDPSK